MRGINSRFILTILLTGTSSLSAVFNRELAERITVEKDSYKILGIEKDASEEDVKRAYRKLALMFHPDKLAKESKENKKLGEDAFKKISHAYEFLTKRKPELQEIFKKLEKRAEELTAQLLTLIKELAQISIEEKIPVTLTQRKNKFIEELKKEPPLFLDDYIMILNALFDNNFEMVKMFKAETKDIFLEMISTGDDKTRPFSDREEQYQGVLGPMPMLFLALFDSSFQDLYFNTWLKMFALYQEAHLDVLKKFNELKEITQTYFSQRFKISQKNFDALNKFAKQIGVEPIKLEPAVKRPPVKEGELNELLLNLEIELYALSRMVS